LQKPSYQIQIWCARLVQTQDTFVASEGCADVAQKPAQHAEELARLVLRWYCLNELTKEEILPLAGLGE
jgi:hypothetical protein